MTQNTLRQVLVENEIRDADESALDWTQGAFDISEYSDAELLSLFLGGRKDSRIQTAKKALEKRNGLIGLLRLCLSHPGNNLPLSKKSCQLIQASIELAQRSILRGIEGTDVLSSPEHVRQYLALHLACREDECFGVVFLDNRHRVIAFRDIFYGTIDSAAVYPRVVLKHCLKYNAAACILYHNHPSGTAEPSDTDVRLTRKLVDALNLVDVRTLDHVVIGQGVLTSMAERGLM